MVGPRRSWSPEEDEFLRRNFHILTYPQLAARLGVDNWAVQSRGHLLGLGRKTALKSDPSRGDSAKLAYVYRRFLGLKFEEVGARLGFSKQRAEQLFDKFSQAIPLDRGLLEAAEHETDR